MTRASISPSLTGTVVGGTVVGGTVVGGTVVGGTVVGGTVVLAMLVDTAEVGIEPDSVGAKDVIDEAAVAFASGGAPSDEQAAPNTTPTNTHHLEHLRMPGTVHRASNHRVGV